MAPHWVSRAPPGGIRVQSQEEPLSLAGCCPPNKTKQPPHKLPKPEHPEPISSCAHSLSPPSGSALRVSVSTQRQVGGGDDFLLPSPPGLASLPIPLPSPLGFGCYCSAQGPPTWIPVRAHAWLWCHTLAVMPGIPEGTRDHAQTCDVVSGCLLHGRHLPLSGTLARQYSGLTPEPCAAA